MANQTQKRITGLRRNQQFLYIGIFTLVAVVVWVGGSLFQSQKKTGISLELQKMAIPLNPNISTLVIDRIESKTTYSPEELAEFEIFRLRIEDENRARLADEPAETSALTDVINQASEEPSIEPTELVEPVEPATISATESEL